MFGIELVHWSHGKHCFEPGAPSSAPLRDPATDACCDERRERSRVHPVEKLENARLGNRHYAAIGRVASEWSFFEALHLQITARHRPLVNHDRPWLTRR
jgi:hypothetical protein